MIKQQTQQTRQPLLVALSLAASSAMLVLTACGGGGGGGTGATAVTIDPAALKGRWETPTGAASDMTAVIIPGDSGKANAWLLAKDASRLVKLVVTSDSSAKGQSYALPSSSANGQAVTGQVTATLTTTPKRISFTGVNAAALALDQRDTLAASAVQADTAGTWSTTSGDKARVLNWTVTSTGSISGSSTTGCSYTGAVTAMTGSNVYSAQVNESCSDNTKTTFNGIATINAAKNLMTVAATTADETRGVAVFFAKK